MSRFIGLKGDQSSYQTAISKARFPGVSPVGAALPLLGSHSPTDGVLRVMHIMTDGEHPQMSILGYVYFIDKLCNSVSFLSLMNVADKETIIAGLLMAKWKLNRSQIPTPAENLEVWDTLRRTMNHPPEQLLEDFKKAVENCKKHGIDALPDSLADLSETESSNYVRTTVQGVTSLGGKAMTLMDGGGVPWEKFGITITSINNAADRAALKTALTVAPINNWHSEITADQFLSIYNFIGRHLADDYRALIMSSVFVNIAGICRGINMTDRWVESKWRAAVGQYEILATSNLRMSRSIISDFAHRFIGNNTSLNDMYSNLVFTHHIAEASNVPVLKWMIEQAKGTNVTGLHAIAEAAAKFDVFTYHTIEGLVPESQIKNALTAMAYTIQHPYSTLKGPKVAVGLYTDLAYIALSLTMETETREMITGLRKRLSVEPSRLAMGIQLIRNCQEEGSRSLIDINTIIRKYGVNAAPDGSSRCSVLAYNEFAEAEGQGPGGETPQRIDLTKAPEMTILQMKPHLRSYTLRDIIDKQQKPKDKAFQAIVAAFRLAVGQTTLTPAELFEGDVQGPLTIQPVAMPDTLTAHYGILDITVPPAESIPISTSAIINEAVLKPFPA